MPLNLNFSEELESELNVIGAYTTNEAGGTVLQVVTAEYQADLYMAGQIQSKKAIMVLSTDWVFLKLDGAHGITLVLKN